MRAPELAVIVTTYQLPWHLRRVLESLARQRTPRRLEVIVSDDGSTDETEQVVAEFASAAPFRVQFVTHPHADFHAARCRNDGVRHSVAPHLLFVDGDCLLPPDHIERHLKAWRPGRVTCSYCVRFDKALSAQVTLESVASGQFTQWAPPDERRKLRTMHLKALVYGLIGHRTKPAFRAGDFSLARADFERVNGFDESFRGWGCEDDDFGRRLKAASVRPLSVLDRTCVYHLWHAPAPTRPRQWKLGGNVAYLQRPIRLTRCVAGLTRRQPHELTVSLAARAADGAAERRLLALHRWIVVDTSGERTDLELLCLPGSGRWRGRSDCRVLVLLDERRAPDESGYAHIVLSPSGLAGRSNQVRLRLDDTVGFWNALQGSGLLPRRVAA